MENLKGIMVGGPGPTKYDFVEGNYITNEVKKKIIIQDLSYTDDFGLNELLEKSQDVLSEEEVMDEKKLMNRFLETLATAPGKAEYGMDKVIEKIKLGAAEIVLISESLDDESIEKIETEAEAFGSEVMILSLETREGAQLRDLGKVAAIFLDTQCKMTNKRRGMFSEFWDHLVLKFSGLIWFVIVALLIWLLIQLLYLFFDFSLLDWFQTIPFLYPFVNYVYSQIAEKTILGILYLFSISSLFIFPVPLEALFFTYIKGFNPLFFLIISTLGLYVGQIFNYFLGRYFGFIFGFMFNNRTKKNIKTKITRYGGLAIVLMEMFPLPFQLFNFFAGAFKYPASKFLFYSLIGLILKNLILFTIYVKFFA